MCVLLSIKREHYNDGEESTTTPSVEFEVMPIIHENMNALSNEGLDTLTDILRGMCAVAILAPSQHGNHPLLDTLLNLYYANFEDLNRSKDKENSNGKENTVIPFPGPPVTKH